MRSLVILRRLLLLVLACGLSSSCLYQAPDGEGSLGNVLSAITVAASGTTSSATSTPTPTSTTSSTISRFVAVGNVGIAMYSDDVGVTWTDSSPGGGQLEDVAFGNNVYVAVGAAGRVLWSADGTSWTEVTPAITGNTLNGIAFGGGRFVTVGDNGAIFHSSDGANWTDVSVGGNKLNKIAYGSGTFVTTGTFGQVHWSTDGAVWNSLVVAGTSVGGMAFLAYGGGRFIGVASKTVTNHQSWWTNDGGATWNQVGVTAQNPSPPGLASGIGYGAGRWFTVEWKGYHSYSADGTSWTSAGAVGDPRDFATDGTTIVGVGFHTAGGNTAGVTYSTDGINWTEIAAPPGGTAFLSITLGTVTP